MIKNWLGNTKDPGSIPGSESSPGEGNGNPLQYSFLENPHGQRSLGPGRGVGGYNPQGLTESDTAKAT